MNALNMLLTGIILYMPYQRHYPLALPGTGINLTNLLFALVLVMVLAGKGRPTAPRAPLKGYFLFFFAALAWAFLVGQAYDRSLLSEDLTLLKNGIFYMLFYFLFYHAVTDLKSIRWLFAAILLVTTVVSAHLFRQALDYGIGVYNEAHRAAGPFGETSSGSNVAAAYLVIFVPLFFAVASTCKSRPVYRLLAFALGMFGVAAAVFTYSRQAYFILAVLFLVLAFRRSVLLALLICVAVLNYQAWAPDSVVDRINMTKEVPAVPGERKFDDSTESRFVIWEGAKQMIAERPWGIGLNHFKREMGTYVSGFKDMDAHNGYVLVTAEAGLAGGVAMVALLCACMVLGLKVRHLEGSEDAQLLGGAYTVAVLAVMLANLYGTRIFDSEVMGNFWILSALVARYYTLAVEERRGAAGKAAAGGETVGVGGLVLDQSA